jgi:hypothetical protein
MSKWFERPEPMTFLELREQLLTDHDLLVSAIRVSVGVATNFADVYRFMCFMQGFVDRTTDEIGAPSSSPDGCTITRDSA